MEKVIQLLIWTFNFWHFVVCFDSLVVVASSSAPEAELITTKCQKNKVQIESWITFSIIVFQKNGNIKRDSAYDDEHILFNERQLPFKLELTY